MCMPQICCLLFLVNHPDKDGAYRGMPVAAYTEVHSRLLLRCWPQRCCFLVLVDHPNKDGSVTLADGDDVLIVGSEPDARDAPNVA